MSFADEINRYTEEYQRRLQAVARESVQDVAEIANQPRAKGGRMPVDTGFLRNSIRAAIGETPSSGSGSVIETLARWDAGESITVGWTAVYARPMEYRYGFMRGAVELWPRIVDANARRAMR